MFYVMLMVDNKKLANAKSHIQKVTNTLPMDPDYKFKGLNVYTNIEII